MKVKIIRGFLHPRDLARKGDRRAVVLGEYRDHWVVAPATTYFERSGRVPPGHVLISPKTCGQFSRTGFDRDEILISIRDAVRVERGSVWLSGVSQIGGFDIEKEPRLLRRFGEEIRAFPIGERIYN
jgi:hypothetical protein